MVAINQKTDISMLAVCMMAAITAAGGWPADSSGQPLSTLEHFEHHYPSTCERFQLSFLKVEQQEPGSMAEAPPAPEQALPNACSSPRS